MRVNNPVYDKSNYLDRVQNADFNLSFTPNECQQESFILCHSTQIIYPEPPLDQMLSKVYSTSSKTKSISSRINLKLKFSIVTVSLLTIVIIFGLLLKLNNPVLNTSIETSKTVNQPKFNEICFTLVKPTTEMLNSLVPEISSQLKKNNYLSNSLFALLNRISDELPDYKQQKQWIIDLQKSEASDIPTSIETDKKGNIYVGGYISKILKYENNSDLSGSTPIHAIDALLVKFNAKGKLLWLKTWGSDKFDEVTDIAIDTDGNLIAIGLEGYHYTALNEDRSTTSGFIRMYNSNGNLIWNSILDKENFEIPQNVLIHNNQISVLAYTNYMKTTKTKIIFNGKEKERSSNSRYIKRVQLLKFDVKGKLNSKKELEVFNDKMVLKSKFDLQENIYLETGSKNNKDIIHQLTKFNSNFEKKWDIYFNGNREVGFRLLNEFTIAEDGSVYILKIFQKDYLKNIISLFKISSSGNIIWESKLPYMYSYTDSFNILEKNNKIYILTTPIDHKLTIFKYGLDGKLEKTLPQPTEKEIKELKNTKAKLNYTKLISSSNHVRLEKSIFLNNENILLLNSWVAGLNTHMFLRVVNTDNYNTVLDLVGNPQQSDELLYSYTCKSGIINTICTTNYDPMVDLTVYFASLSKSGKLLKSKPLLKCTNQYKILVKDTFDEGFILAYRSVDDYIIQKYDIKGTLIWTCKNLVQGSSVIVSCIKPNNDLSTFISCYKNHSLITNHDISEIPNPKDSQAFLVKLNPRGEIEKRILFPKEIAYTSSISIDKYQNIYLQGGRNNVMNGDGVQEPFKPFIFKFNKDLKLIFKNDFGFDTNNQIYTQFIDINQNFCFLMDSYNSRKQNEAIKAKKEIASVAPAILFNITLDDDGEIISKEAQIPNNFDFVVEPFIDNYLNFYLIQYDIKPQSQLVLNKLNREKHILWKTDILENDQQNKISVLKITYIDPLGNIYLIGRYLDYKSHSQALLLKYTSSGRLVLMKKWSGIVKPM